jgi:hypothetical protein
MIKIIVSECQSNGIQWSGKYLGNLLQKQMREECFWVIAGPEDVFLWNTRGSKFLFKNQHVDAITMLSTGIVVCQNDRYETNDGVYVDMCLCVWDKYATPICTIPNGKNQFPVDKYGILETKPGSFIVHGTTVIKEYDPSSKTKQVLVKKNNTRKRVGVDVGPSSWVNSLGEVRELYNNKPITKISELMFDDHAYPNADSTSIGLMRPMLDINTVLLERWTVSPTRLVFSIQGPKFVEHTIFLSCDYIAYYDVDPGVVVIVNTKGDISATIIVQNTAYIREEKVMRGKFQENSSGNLMFQDGEMVIEYNVLENRIVTTTKIPLGTEFIACKGRLLRKFKRCK